MMTADATALLALSERVDQLAQIVAQPSTNHGADSRVAEIERGFERLRADIVALQQRHDRNDGAVLAQAKRQTETLIAGTHAGLGAILKDTTTTLRGEIDTATRTIQTNTASAATAAAEANAAAQLSISSATDALRGWSFGFAHHDLPTDLDKAEQRAKSAVTPIDGRIAALPKPKYRSRNPTPGELLANGPLINPLKQLQAVRITAAQTIKQSRRNLDRLRSRAGVIVNVAAYLKGAGSVPGDAPPHILSAATLIKRSGGIGGIAPQHLGEEIEGYGLRALSDIDERRSKIAYLEQVMRLAYHSQSVKYWKAWSALSESTKAKQQYARMAELAEESAIEARRTLRAMKP